MNYQHVPIIDLPAYQMDKESIDTLSYIFTDGNIEVNSFVELLTYFMAGLPDNKQVSEFWDEVGEWGYGGGMKL